MNEVDFSILYNKTIVKIEGLEEGNDYVKFFTSDGDEYVMYHSQDCCEDVSINDICGDIKDILNTPILLAEEVTDCDMPEDVNSEDYYHDSYTWTFYKLSTIKGDITIRWYGGSNGYYSERVDFVKI